MPAAAPITGFPDSFTTPRLRAERLRPEHTAEIHRMHQDAEQMRMLGGIRDEAQTAAYMDRNLTHWDQHRFGLWLLRDVPDDHVVGRALLRRLTLDGNDEVEVGYSFFPAFWGAGLATEIAAACVEHAKTSLGLRSVVALTKPENVASQRVMTKIGMAFERELDHEHARHVLFRTPGWRLPDER